MTVVYFDQVIDFPPIISQQLLLLFSLNDQEFLSTFDCVFYIFFRSIINFNLFYTICLIIFMNLSFSFLVIMFALVTYIYISIELTDCDFMSSSKLNAILLDSSESTIYFSLLNFCFSCSCNVFKNSL